MSSQSDIKLLPIEIYNEITTFFGSEIKTIFDVGSCDGQTSIAYAKTFPNCNVYAIEADPDNFNILNKNILSENLTNQISTFNFALGHTTSKHTFYKLVEKTDSSLNGEIKENYICYNSLLSPSALIEIHPDLMLSDEVLIDTVSLKDFVNKEKLNQIDSLHLFVQGSELHVLKGAKDFIKSIKMIWLEVFNDTLYSDLPLKTEVENYLSKVGFTKIKDSCQGFTGKQLWVNYRLFPRKRITHTIWKLYSDVF